MAVRSARGAGGARDPALALALRAQQGGVAGREQLVGAHRRLPLRDADRRGDAFAAGVRGQSAQTLERPVGRRRGAVEVGVRQDHHELVAAVARDAVEGPELTHERADDLAQHRVTGRVPVLVVDDLEVVEVDQQAGERPARAHRAPDLLVQAAAHRPVVHAARDRIGAGLRAGAHQRQRRSPLLDQRAREIDGAGLVDGRQPAHEHHDRLDLGSLHDRQQQHAAHLAGGGQPRHAGGEFLRVRGEEAAARACHPAHARRALGARREVAEPPLALEQVHVDEVVGHAVAGEMVDVHLFGARHLEQLARQRAEDRVRVGDAVGERRQTADPREDPLHTPGRRGIRT